MPHPRLRQDSRVATPYTPARWTLVIVATMGVATGSSHRNAVEREAGSAQERAEVR